MAYFEDLSEYAYLARYFGRPGTKNVGWLEPGHPFAKGEPTAELLARLLEVCRISVAQSRGFQDCGFCGFEGFVQTPTGNLLLGTSEIRVFSRSGEIYAAPTMIYHYVASHGYRPPDEFIEALIRGPDPSSQEYFARLRELGLEWAQTYAPAEKPIRRRPEPPLSDRPQGAQQR